MPGRLSLESAVEPRPAADDRRTFELSAPRSRATCYTDGVDLRVECITIPAVDPPALALFWQTLLGGTITPNNRGRLLEPAGSGTTSRILFARTTGHAGPMALGWHLNSVDGTLKEQVAQLLALGATIVDDVPSGPLGYVGLGRVLLADPEGNTFAVGSSDAEVKAVEEALEAGEHVDATGSYFEGKPQDPAASTVGYVSVN